MAPTTGENVALYLEPVPGVLMIMLLRLVAVQVIRTDVPARPVVVGLVGWRASRRVSLMNHA